MTERRKNILYLILLISLCGIIMCKLKVDNKDSTVQVEKVDVSHDSSEKPQSLPKKEKEKEETKDILNEESITQAENLENTTTEIHQEAELKKEKEDIVTIENQQTQPEKKKKSVVSKPKPAPQITFEEMEWDFGEITEGDIIEKKFKFTNTGNAPLEILATSATCGCTRPSFPFLDIAPGESNVIGVRYNSVGKDGLQEPEITVESNTSPKITMLKIKGIVHPKPKEEKETATKKDSID